MNRTSPSSRTNPSIRTGTRTALALCLCAVGALAQTPASPPHNQPAPPAVVGATTPAGTALAPAATPLDMARAAFAAQGGEKFRGMQNMVLIGSVDLYSPNSTQSLAGKFGLIYAGDRTRLNIQSALFNLEAITDGDRSYSSMRGFQLPPVSRYGLPVLAKFDQPGYTVSALDPKKKARGFRITDAEGHATDFYLDAATNRVARYEVPLDGLIFSVEHKKVQEFEGVLVPMSFVQKLDTPNGSFFAEFKVKEAHVNQTLPADVFAIPGQ